MASICYSTWMIGYRWQMCYRAIETAVVILYISLFFLIPTPHMRACEYCKREKCKKQKRKNFDLKDVAVAGAHTMIDVVQCSAALCSHFLLFANSSNNLFYVLNGIPLLSSTDYCTYLVLLIYLQFFLKKITHLRIFVFVLSNCRTKIHVQILFTFRPDTLFLGSLFL